MLKQENNFAFIDGTNLHKGVSELGWQLDYNKQGETKGNCDAEMVLQTVSDMYENNYEKAVIVTGDGDFACLASFLSGKNRLKAVISPNYKKASVLLKKAVFGKIFFLDRFKERLKYRKNNEKAPL